MKPAAKVALIGVGVVTVGAIVTVNLDSGADVLVKSADTVTVVAESKPRTEAERLEARILELAEGHFITTCNREVQRYGPCKKENRLVLPLPPHVAEDIAFHKSNGSFMEWAPDQIKRMEALYD